MEEDSPLPLNMLKKIAAKLGMCRNITAHPNCTELSEAINDGMIGFPEPDPLPSDDQDTPYFIIGDDGFPLHTWMMKPFGCHNLPELERIFNIDFLGLGGLWKMPLAS